MDIPNTFLDVTNPTEWDLIRALLPPDLEQSAFTSGALLRKRADGFTSAECLLRVLLGYACDQSLRLTAAWAAEADLVCVADTSLLRRFQHCPVWLRSLLGAMLLPADDTLPALGRIRLVDASMLSRPGSTAADWRVHLGFDLVHHQLTDLILTDTTAGETFAHQTLAVGELLIGDRGYGTRANIVHATTAGAALIVRLTWQNVPLQTRDGQPFDVVAAWRELAYGEIKEWAVQTAPTKDLPAVPGRLVIARLPEVEAMAARVKRQRAANKRGRRGGHLDPRTVEACEYLLLFTTLPPTVTAQQVVALYRLRWQVELVFKRLKSLLHLDALPAKTDRLARSWIYAKLLIAVLLDRLAHLGRAFSP
jgi:hypothetical protein